MRPHFLCAPILFFLCSEKGKSRRSPAKNRTETTEGLALDSRRIGKRTWNLPYSQRRSMTAIIKTARGA